jgi:hypothetical protein
MNHTPPKVIFLVVICITFVTIGALALGAWLTSKGYQGGELLLGTGGTGLGGLIGLLSSTRSQSPDPVPTTVVSSPANPVQTNVTNPTTDPVHTDTQK